MYSDVASTRQFVKPEMVVSHFHLRAGDRVADFGAGTGYFLKALSKAAGNDGKVYACEIQKNLVEQLRAHIKEWRLPNTEALWCDFESIGGTKLRDGILDAGLLANVLFQLEDKETALAEIARAVRIGGKLLLIDWTDSFQGLGPHPLEVVTESSARSMVENAGFRFERAFPAGEHHYGLAFRRV